MNQHLVLMPELRFGELGVLLAREDGGPEDRPS